MKRTAADSVVEGAICIVVGVSVFALWCYQGLRRLQTKARKPEPVAESRPVRTDGPVAVLLMSERNEDGSRVWN